MPKENWFSVAQPKSIPNSSPFFQRTALLDDRGRCDRFAVEKDQAAEGGYNEHGWAKDTEGEGLQSVEAGQDHPIYKSN